MVYRWKLENLVSLLNKCQRHVLSFTGFFMDCFFFYLLLTQLRWANELVLIFTLKTLSGELDTCCAIFLTVSSLSDSPSEVTAQLASSICRFSELLVESSPSPLKDVEWSLVLFSSSERQPSELSVEQYDLRFLFACSYSLTSPSSSDQESSEFYYKSNIIIIKSRGVKEVHKWKPKA